jgi:carbonic anhydrase
MSSNTIDITKRGVRGRCDLKCAYTFKYPASSSTITNKGIYLALSYDATTMAPVTYNTQPYTVSQIHVYSPSLHLFNGQKEAGELVIVHTPQKGGDNLYVAVPLVGLGGSTGAGAAAIHEIISRAADSAPADGDNATLNLTGGGFTLDTLVPSRLPYISYTGNNVNNDYQSPWIVFGRENGINLGTDDVATLGKIVQPFDFVLTGEQLYLNEAGANSLAADQTGDVYISCEPTNTSEEQVEVTTTTAGSGGGGGSTKWNWGDMFKGSGWAIAVQVLIIIAVVVGGFFGVNYLGRARVGGGMGAAKGGDGVAAVATEIATQLGGGGGDKHVRFAKPLSRSRVRR